MINYDYANLGRKTLILKLEQERQAWLNAGMNEADIYRIHFGEDDENGKGGDYGVWLSERKHIRTDRKNSLGATLSIDEADSNGIWICDTRDELSDTEIKIDLKHALETLTKLQRYCFMEICVKKRTYREVAQDLEKCYTTVEMAVIRAKRKLEKVFSK